MPTLNDYVSALPGDKRPHQSLTQLAMKNLEEGKALLVGISGKKGSGKDTLAQSVGTRITQTYEKPYTVTPASRSIRQEASEMLYVFAEWLEDDENFTLPDRTASTVEPQQRINDITRQDFLDNFSRHFLLSRQQTNTIADLIVPLIYRVGKVDGYNRENEVTQLLQYLGGPVRQEGDPLYWMRRMLAEAIPLLAEEQLVFVPDIRYVQDAETLLNSSGTLIRLDVDPGEQASRLAFRDNVVVPPETLTHISETALDDYQRFDLRFNTTGLTAEETGETVLQYLVEKNGLSSAKPAG